jgi:hypothetical protein
MSGAGLANSTHLISQFEKKFCALSVSQELVMFLFHEATGRRPSSRAAAFSLLLAVLS